VTAGPTREPIDPVRYLSNHSSGKQGYAIASALADLGADVTLVSGPVSIRPPSNVTLVKVETALEMLAACKAALPSDIFVSVAAVADWRPASYGDKKIKVIKHATAKRLRKTCDWIVANDVSGDVMGGDHNKMILVTEMGADEWPRLTKADSAKRLAAKIAEHFA